MGDGPSLPYSARGLNVGAFINASQTQSGKVNCWQDPNGIYVIISTADISSTETEFCKPGAPPHHAIGIVNGALVNYIFLGHLTRFPSWPGRSSLGQHQNNTYAGDV